MKLGHTGVQSLHALASQELLKCALTCDLESCEHCDLNKRKVRFRTSINRPKGILDLAHVDVWEPSKGASLEGKHQFIYIVDDCSRHV